MTAPKKGDRVLVTFETDWLCDWTASDSHKGYAGPQNNPIVIPNCATVEVLPPPEPPWAHTPGVIAMSKESQGIRRCHGDGLWHSTYRSDEDLSFADWDLMSGPITLLYDPSAES